MAKDYKNSPKPKDKPKKKSGGFPGWGWFVLGIIAAVAVIKGGPVLWEAEMHAGKHSTADKPAAAATTHMAAPSATTATHYDFYKMLPSFQVVIPGQDKDVKSGNETAPVQQPGSYILQVGSFPNFADADKMKATLALQGIESNIQEVQVNNGSTWNRVRIGPIKNLKELNDLRARLAQDHIDPLVIKQGP
ncbi:MAG TPA: SPOR domain-containing protein [Gammaproteobacteria bacterium]|nr:SPOR domain-containing protein [Gammaproteobacteria bacterium]